STLARSSALDLTSAPSTSRTGVRATDEPGSPSIFAILTRSPSATLYCFPPGLKIAYIEGYPFYTLGSRPLLVFLPKMQPCMDNFFIQCLGGALSHWDSRFFAQPATVKEYPERGLNYKPCERHGFKIHPDRGAPNTHDEYVF